MGVILTVVGVHVLVSHTATGYELVAIVLGVIGALGFLATGYAVIRTNLTSQTISNLEKNNTSLHERVQLVEDSNATLKAENVELKGQNAKQAEEISWLTDQVTGATAIAKLSELIVTHHTEVTHLLGDIVRQVVQVPGSED